MSRAMPCDAWSFCIQFKCKGPTQRLKTAKKSILRPLWTPNPNFWYLIFGQFFFSSKYWHVGCPEQCHVMPGLFRNIFKRKGTHLEAQNGQKVDFTALFDLKSQSFCHSEPLIGSPGFEKVSY